jgi:hypothetical protein
MRVGLSLPLAKACGICRGSQAKRPGPRFVPLLTQLDQQAALDHVKALIFTVMDVQRRTRSPGPH